MRLYARDGTLVTSTEIPVMRPMPEIIALVDRFFVRNQRGQYSEAFCWPAVKCIPVEMPFRVCRRCDYSDQDLAQSRHRTGSARIWVERDLCNYCAFTSETEPAVAQTTKEAAHVELQSQSQKRPRGY